MKKIAQCGAPDHGTHASNWTASQPLNPNARPEIKELHPSGTLGTQAVPGTLFQAITISSQIPPPPPPTPTPLYRPLPFIVIRLLGQNQSISSPRQEIWTSSRRLIMTACGARGRLLHIERVNARSSERGYSTIIYMDQRSGVRPLMPKSACDFFVKIDNGLVMISGLLFSPAPSPPLSLNWPNRWVDWWKSGNSNDQ